MKTLLFKRWWHGSPNGRRGYDGHYGQHGFNEERGYPGEVIIVDSRVP